MPHGRPTISSDEWTVVLPSLAGPPTAAQRKVRPPSNLLGSSGSARAHNDGEADRGQALRSSIPSLPPCAGAAGVRAGAAAQPPPRLSDETCRVASALCIGDVHRDKDLRTQLAGLPLNKFFNSRGTQRFRRLGLSFAAKHHPQIRSAFGSKNVNTGKAEATSKQPSAKAYFLAVTAKERDIELGKEQATAFFSSINDAQKFRTDDVRERQIQLLFAEVPDFERYLPHGASRADLVPVELSKDEELQSRRAADRANQYLTDTSWTHGQQMEWMLTRAEVLALSQVVDLWTRVAHGVNCPLGMERGTFCRLLLDLGLVDQTRVPLFWAVSLFDSVAVRVRLEAPSSLQAPVVSIVNRWHLVDILETICRQHFTKDSMGSFLSSLLRIARLRLPPYVLDESGLKEETFQALLSGRAPGSPDSPLRRWGPRGLESGEGPRASPAPQAPQELAFGARSSDHQATRQDRQREALVREQLLLGMLSEPEVLHVVAQYQQLLHHLHASYADEHGDMSFPALLQFCLDFHLAPTIASTHYLQEVYRNTRSAEVAPWKIPPQLLPPGQQRRHSSHFDSNNSSEEGSPMVPMHSERIGMEEPGSNPMGNPRARQRRHSVGNASQASMSLASARRGPGACSASPRPPALHSTPEDPRSCHTSSPRPDAGGPSRRGSAKARPPQVVVPPVACGAARGAARGASCGDLRAADASETPGAGGAKTAAVTFGEDFDLPPSPVPSPLKETEAFPATLRNWPPALPWAGLAGTAPAAGPNSISKHGRSHQSPPQLQLVTTYPVAFGPGALAEALCRIAFAYLGSYGNAQQQSMTGYLRVVWMMVHLRHAFVHLLQSLENSSGGAREAPHESLRRALGTPLDLWLLPPLPAVPLLPAPVFRQGLPKRELSSKKRQTKKDLRKSRTQAPGEDLSQVASAFVARTRRSKASTVAVQRSSTNPGATDSRLRESLADDSSDQRLSPPSAEKPPHDPMPDEPVVHRGSRGSLRRSNSFPEESLGALVAARAVAARAGAPATLPEEGQRAQCSDSVSLGAHGAARAGSAVAGGAADGGVVALPEEGQRAQDQSTALPTGLQSTPCSAYRRAPSPGAAALRAQRPKSISRASSKLSPRDELPARYGCVLPLPACDVAGPPALQLGTPIVTDGACGLCGALSSDRRWGNPRCQGCSIVDRLSFEHHPQRRLLQGWPPEARPEPLSPKMPMRLQRSPLSPPPFGANCALGGR